eukprot:SAG11_NODE_1775_length_4269_cov_3.089448_4_plen_560_part_00
MSPCRGEGYGAGASTILMPAESAADAGCLTSKHDGVAACSSAMVAAGAEPSVAAPVGSVEPWIFEPVVRVPLGPHQDGPREWRRGEAARSRIAAQRGAAVTAFLLGTRKMRDAAAPPSQAVRQTGEASALLAPPPHLHPVAESRLRFVLVGPQREQLAWSVWRRDDSFASADHHDAIPLRLGSEWQWASSIYSAPPSHCYLPPRWPLERRRSRPISICVYRDRDGCGGDVGVASQVQLQMAGASEARASAHFICCTVPDVSSAKVELQLDFELLSQKLPPWNRLRTAGPVNTTSAAATATGIGVSPSVATATTPPPRPPTLLAASERARLLAWLPAHPLGGLLSSAVVRAASASGLKLRATECGLKRREAESDQDYVARLQRACHGRRPPFVRVGAAYGHGGAARAEHKYGEEEWVTWLLVNLLRLGGVPAVMLPVARPCWLDQQVSGVAARSLTLLRGAALAYFVDGVGWLSHEVCRVHFCPLNAVITEAQRLCSRVAVTLHDGWECRASAELFWGLSRPACRARRNRTAGTAPFRDARADGAGRWRLWRGQRGDDGA